MTKSTRLVSLFMAAVYLLSASMVSAQGEASEAEMATGLRSNGLIWIVVGVIVIIVGGLLVYLYRIDRKVSQLEKEIKVKP
jgi:nitric oxide reductase large subunit